MAFAGKTALVTGGAGGLGAAISRAFLEAGANVIAIDVNDKLISDFNAANASSKLLVLQADVTSESSIDGVFSAATAKFGQVDIVVNNAGIMDTMQPVDEVDRALWERVIGVNLTGAYIVSHRATRHMLDRKLTGSIVNVQSLAGSTGFAAGAAYTASKWGLHGLTLNMAAYYRDKGIRVNAIAPGPMETNIAAGLGAADFSQGGYAAQMKKGASMGGVSPLSEVAAVVLFLSSEGNSTLSGAVVPVDSAWGAF